MPLQVSTDEPSAIAASLTARARAEGKAFLVVYASLTDGRSWCGDCRYAEPFVEDIFKTMNAVPVVYAGQPTE